MKIFTRYAFCFLIVLFPSILWGQPVANFTATPLVGCAPLVVQFTDQSTGNPTNWQWNLGNSATSVLQNPSTTYTTPGTYTVTLTVSNASGSNTLTQTAYITVYPNPIVDFNATPTAGCPPLSTVFNNSSDPVMPGTATYTWNFGDGSSSTAQNPSYTYNPPGQYNVTLIVTNSGGCVSSLTKPNYIQVYTPPVADFTANNTFFCYPPATAAFTANITGSGPYTYNWNFGDGATGTGATPSHTYTAPGSYTVTLIVTDVNGCKDTLVKPSYIAIGTITAAFNSPSTACEGAPITFNNTSVGASTYVWNFGDGTSSTAVSPSHSYTAAGTYTVELIASNGPCSDTQTVSITVNPRPDAQFSFSPQEPCPAPATIQFTNQTVGGGTYTWIFGDGGTSTATNPSHIYNNNGLYTVLLIAENSFGCKDTLVKPDSVRIHDLILDAGASPFYGCVPLSVDFTTARFTNIPNSGLLYPYGVDTWYWDFGDGSTSTDSTPTHIFTTPGTYNVYVTVTTANGCTAIDSLIIQVGSIPEPFFTSTPDTVCVNTLITFNNLSTGATNYIWDFGNGGTSTVANPTYFYDTTGTFIVTLYAYNNGCEAIYTDTQAIVVLPPTSLFTPIYDCDTPFMVKFDDNATIGATTQTWLFGDGNTTTSIFPTHTYSAPGTYDVTLITFNASTGCSDTEVININIFDPTASFVTADTTICRGDSIVFHSSFTHTATQYDWNIDGVVFTDTSSYLGYKFNQNGIYTISVMIRDEHLCFDTATREHYVIVATPEASFSATPNPGCIPLTVQFTETSTHVTGTYSTSIDWDFGDGNTTTTTNPNTTNTYTAVGLYDIQMIVTNNIGCVDTIFIEDHIDARQPSAAFAANDTTACIGQNIIFVNLSSGTSLSYFWDFGDGSTSTSFNPTHTYNAVGTYTVRLIAVDPTGCTDTLIKPAYIGVTKPDASFTISDTFAICPPLNAQFTNTTTGGATYFWNFGNGASSTIQNPSAIYSDPGIHNIYMIATDIHGCKDTAYGYTHVLGYAGGLTYTPLEGCEPLEVFFTANITNVPSLVWDFSDGTTEPVTGNNTTTHTYVTPGAYVPKLILSDGAGCVNSSSGIDTIKVDGIDPGFITSPACIQTNILIEDTSYSYFSDVVSWNWNINNGELTGNQATIIWNVQSPGVYPIQLIVENANGCTDTLYRNLTVHGLPVIEAYGDTLVCVGDYATITASGGVSYTWSAPDNSLSCTNCQSPQASPTTPTLYTVIGTDANGCQNKATVTIGIQPITTSFVDPGGSICIDSFFVLNAFGAERYEWKPKESLDDPFSSTPIATPLTTTHYTVLAWEGSCPPDSHQVTVVVNDKPNVNAGVDQTIISGNAAMLFGTGSNIASYLWGPEESLNCTTCSNPIATPNETTSYILTGISSNGCRKSDTVTVFVICDNSQVFIPNTFSPNGDGQNEVFYPRGKGIKEIKSFRIYNRWGELVFEKRNIPLNDEANGWDGRYNGSEASSDVYVYVIDAICDNGSALSWKGDISLLR